MKTNADRPARGRMLLTAGSSALGATMAWLHWGGTLLALICAISLALLVVAIFTPKAYLPVYRAMDRLLQWLVQGFSWLLLALVYVLLFIPARLFLLVARKPALEPGPDAMIGTYWKTPEPEKSRHSFSRQF